MNALELIRETCAIIGQPQPNTVVGSSDAGVRQLLALLNNEGRILAAEFRWEALTREATFVTVSTEDQGAITTIIGAANAYRYIVNDTMFNRTTKLPVMGPKSSLEWQLGKSLGITGPFPEYRVRGGHLLFDTTPNAGDSVYFEYVTKNWCTSSDGTEQRRAIAHDEDEVLLSDEIMQFGLEWRWRKAKGFDYTEEFNTYERLKLDAKTRDATKARARLDSSVGATERRMAISPGSWPL